MSDVQRSESGGDEMSLVEQIVIEIRAGKVELPVLSDSAQRVRSAIESEARVGTVVSIIEREPPVAATVLRYANSIAFAGLSGVTDLYQAVARLGMKATEHTVVSVTLRNVFSSPDPGDELRLRALWDHSLAVALGARRIATMMRYPSPELAFLAGLMHDVGKVLVLRTVARIKKRDPNRRLSEAGLHTLFGALNTQVGSRLVEAWGMPAPVHETLGVEDQSPLAVDASPLLPVVSLAHRIAGPLVTGLGSNDPATLAASPAARAMEADASTIAEMCEAIENDLQVASTTFAAAA